MRKSLPLILIIFALLSFNLQSVSAISNGGVAAGGLAAKVSTSSGQCSGAIWQGDIVITAAHCVITPSGILATQIRVSAYISGIFRFTEVAGVIVPKEYPGDNLNIYGQSSSGDIAFLILKDKCWNSPLYPNLRIATTSDWAVYSASQTSLEIIGYGLTSDVSTEMLDKSPLSGIFNLNVYLSAGSGKDWAVLNSNSSATCKGDSGAPVLYYRAAESALVLVGIVSGTIGASTNCGSFQFGAATSVFTKVSSYSGLAASTLNTQSKYRYGADILTTAYESLDAGKSYITDLDDFAEKLPPSTKKRLFSKNKNIETLVRYIDDYKTKISEQEAVLNKSMEFSFINSAVLAANTPGVGANLEKVLKPFEIKIDALAAKIYKALPSYVCVGDLQTKDLPSTKRCPKGYEKTELPKPF